MNNLEIISYNKAINDAREVILDIASDLIRENKTQECLVVTGACKTVAKLLKEYK